ncbi:MAG: MBL fold metallo-hydrolase [Hyphomonadaceae bacterium]|nr:MBL fold metallo-hydrolase [Hyphomonadaceae bacterium]
MTAKHRFYSALLIGPLFGIVAACTSHGEVTSYGPQTCQVELIILGAGQDAGAPQFGNPDDPAWQDPDLRLTATALAVVDQASGERYLFEATPHITEQLNRLDQIVPSTGPNEGVSGVFLTHAHIGHYAGLMFFGREVAGASGVPVFAMPRMYSYLETNGPWSQLVDLNNINLIQLEDQTPIRVSDRLSVIPFRVPHRDEFSETVGFTIEVMDGKAALFLPDIDSWEDLETEFDMRIDELVGQVDYAFIDATFYDDFELPGRDMSLIPHPRVTESMDRFSALSAERKAGIHFIHYNHTNPIRFADSAQTQTVLDRGFNVAREGDRHCLSSDHDK